MRAQLSTLMLILMSLPIVAKSERPWHDPSPHKVTFVTVEKDVRLEVLDWGGSGRALVLLAGGGNTAHVFDDFALNLRPFYHVYALTRRGAGESSIPTTGYGADRLGADVIAVIDHLKVTRPVLMAHSYGGQEASWVATQHPDRISGVVYLDAVYSYDAAFEAEACYMIEEWKKPIKDLQNQLAELVEEPNDPTEVDQALAKNLAQVAEIVRTQIQIERGRPPRPDPTAADLESFASTRAWYARGAKVWLPESEFRQMLAAGPDGRPTMKFKTPGFVSDAMREGRRAYHVDIPALMLMAAMDDPGRVDMADPQARSSAEKFVWYQHRRLERRAAQFMRDVPKGKLVKVANADHYVFLSNEAEVIREVRSFTEGLR